MSAAAGEPAAPSPSDAPNDVYASLETYDWDNDVEFQSGLHAILGSTSSPEQATELTLRARCFYYARKYNINVDFDAYKAYRRARGRPDVLLGNGVNTSAATAAAPVAAGDDAPLLDGGGQSQQQQEQQQQQPASGIMPAPSSTNPNEPPAPYPTTFAHIVELITSGQPVPGIKEIPSTVLTGQGTEPTKARRKKPWEKDEEVGGSSTEAAVGQEGGGTAA